MRYLLLVLSIVALLYPGFSADTTARAALFELRSVSDEATPGTVPMELITKDHKQTLHVSRVALLDGSAVRSATLATDPASGDPLIEIVFSNEGAKKFADVTSRYLDKRLAVLLEGKLHSAPVIRSRIPGGRAQIAGNFTKEEAGEMVRRINRALEVKNDALRSEPPKNP